MHEFSHAENQLFVRAAQAIVHQYQQGQESPVSGACPATKQDIEELKELINVMANNLKDFIAEQQAFETTVDAAVTALIAQAKTDAETIKTLQNSPGTFSPQDQGLVDTLESSNKSLTTKLAALNNAQTPVAPPAP